MLKDQDVYSDTLISVKSFSMLKDLFLRKIESIFNSNDRKGNKTNKNQ